MNRVRVRLSGSDSALSWFGIGRIASHGQRCARVVLNLLAG